MSGLGLVLPGGGARGAYQAGVLRALATMCGRAALPLSIVSGVSSGAINGAFLAARAHDFLAATEGLWDLWDSLHPERDPGPRLATLA